MSNTKVTFTRRPNNLVAVRCRFVAELRLAGATRDLVDVVVVLGCAHLRAVPSASGLRTWSGSPLR
jgi:hypothetical protein